MPYLGNEPATAYTSTTKDSFSGDGSTTVFTMSKTAEVNAVRVVVENVIQDPTVAYTCSGTTLTFTSAPPSGTNNIYVVHLGPPAATVAPPTTINSNTTFMDGLTLKNGSPEDTDGGRESIVTFKGLQSGQEESTLAQIQASHDGTADDQKGDLIFRTNDGSDGSSPTERLRIDSAGNVGVGTSTITTSTLGTTNTFFELSGDGGSGTLVLSRDTSTDDAELGGIRFTNRNNADDTNLDADGKLVAAISARVETSDSNAGDDSGAHLTFSTKPESGSFTERMRIDDTGGVGIGSTNPNNAFLDISGNTAERQSGMKITMGGVGTGQTSSSYGIQINHQSNNSASASYGIFCQSAQGVGGNTIGVYGSPHANSITQNSNTQSIGVFGQSVTNSAAVGYAPSRSDYLITAGVYGLVTQTGSSANQTSTGGHFRNACTTASYAAGLTCSTVAGPTTIRGIEYNHAGSDVFRVNSNGNCTNTNGSFGAISDERLKENISDAGSQWDDIKAVRVRKYSMKEDELDAADKIGVIAQELEAAGMDGLVENDVQGALQEDGTRDPSTLETTKAVKYSILYMKAVKALQEAMTRIETLETKVAALEAE